MARSRDQTVWAFFRDHPQGSYKTPRAQCIYCNGTMSATTKNMRTHITNCDKVPTAFGRVLIAETLEVQDRDAREEAAEARRAMAAQLNARVYPSFSREERAELDRSFANAVHQTGSEFSMFDHPAWRSFFDVLHLPWSPPSASELSTTLLDSSYQDVMAGMATALRHAPAVTIGIDGATNVLSRSMSNVIAHDPRPWFVEYLRADLKKETVPRVAGKIANTIRRLIQDASLSTDLQQVYVRWIQKTREYWVYGAPEPRSQAVQRLVKLSEELGSLDVLDKLVPLDRKSLASLSIGRAKARSKTSGFEASRAALSDIIRECTDKLYFYHINNNGRILMSGTNAAVNAVERELRKRGLLFKARRRETSDRPDCSVCTGPVDEPYVTMSLCSHVCCVECFENQLAYGELPLTPSLRTVLASGA